MALGFGVKKASKDAAGSSEEAAAPAKGKRRLRDNERLRSVVKESTFSAAIDTLEANERFRLGPDTAGNPQWLALLLDTATIGGLSEKTKRDEAKGSLVQQIMANQVEAIATAEMLDREFIAFVPTAGTLERLGEYSLMTGASYYWVVFRSVDGTLGFNKDIGPASYNDALLIQQGHDMQEVMTASAGDGVNPWNQIVQSAGAPAGQAPFGDGGVAAYSAQAEMGSLVDEIFGDVTPPIPVPAAPAVTPVSPHDTGTEEFEPVVEDGEGFYESLAESEASYDELDVEDGEPFEDVVDSDIADAQDLEEHAGFEEQYDEYAQPEAPVREFTAEEVRDSIARRFLSDDLEMTVDLDEFDTAFGRRAAPTFGRDGLPGGESSEWLAANIAPMIEAADAELAAMRDRHDAVLRQTYIDYTSRHIEEVLRAVSLTEGETQFGEMMAIADEKRSEEQRTAAALIQTRRGELEQKFREEAEQAGAAAAAQAIAAYKSMNRGRHELALAQVDRDVTDRVEKVYEDDRQHILRLRRDAAEVGLQKGMTVILEALGDDRRAQLDEEAALLASWNERILALADQYRKADVVRAEAMAETLARTNAIEAERREHEARMESLRNEHEASLRALRTNLKEAHDESAAKLREIETAWTARFAEAQRQRDEVATTNRELQEQIMNLAPSIREQYQDRLDSMQATRDAYALEVERAAKSAARLQRTMVFLLVIIAIAAVAVGAVMGWSFAQNTTAGAAGVIAETSAVLLR